MLESNSSIKICAEVEYSLSKQVQTVCKRIQVKNQDLMRTIFHDWIFAGIEEKVAQNIASKKQSFLFFFSRYS